MLQSDSRVQIEVLIMKKVIDRIHWNIIWSKVIYSIYSRKKSPERGKPDKTLMW